MLLMLAGGRSGTLMGLFGAAVHIATASHNSQWQTPNHDDQPTNQSLRTGHDTSSTTLTNTMANLQVRANFTLFPSHCHSTPLPADQNPTQNQTKNPTATPNRHPQLPYRTTLT
jgi:hypothetical protein